MSVANQGGKSDPRVNRAAPAHNHHQSSPYPDGVVLLIGEPQGALPKIKGVRFTRSVEKPCGLVVRLPGADIAANFGTLAAEGRLPVPVADLTGENWARADYCAQFFSESSLKEALAATQPIRQILQSMPVMAVGPHHDSLLALRLASSRQIPIEASFAGSKRELVDYAMLTGLVNTRPMLEQLTRSGLLTRQFFDRLHVCESCGSARVAVREVCVTCASGQLREETLVHHYRCAYQGPRSQFEQGQSLVCPKCNRNLRHYGVDYDAPGMIQRCEQCDEIFSDANISFVCTDCGRETPGNDIHTMDWYHYDVTPEGELAAVEGRLPDLQLESYVSGMSGHRTPRDLAMMIDLWRRVHKRYERPFSVALISFGFSDTIETVRQLQAETMVWQIIGDSLRDTDLVAALEHQLVLLLPETPPENTGHVVDRINARLVEATGSAAHVRAELVAEDKLAALIRVLLGG